MGLWFGNLRSGSLARELSFGIFRLGPFVCFSLFENFRLVTSLGDVRLGILVWGLWLVTFSLEPLAWNLRLGNSLSEAGKSLAGTGGIGLAGTVSLTLRNWISAL